MVRSAAKNFQDVAIVTSPSATMTPSPSEMESGGGSLSLKTKWRLAQKAFATTAAYDSAIASTLERIGAPERHAGKFELGGETASRRRCGSASARHSIFATARIRTKRPRCTPTAQAKVWPMDKQLQGKELSYNNIVDLQAAWDLAQEFQEPVCAIIKHTNPCGNGSWTTLPEAYKRALECDPVSAFGGVIGVNRPIDGEAATEMAKLFVEADRRTWVR
jgi:phosphoribosylaminoimidazolecarboxamide formyltransferase / IMP cyclohydrolase